MCFSSYFRINFKAQLNERYYVPSNFGFECIGFSLDSILSSCYFSSFALFYLLLIVLRYLLYSSYISLICTLSLMQIFLCLILLVSNSNIICIALIQVMERTRMIGILKTLGARDSTVLGIFLWQNLKVIGKGMLWGNVLGLGVAALQTYGKVIKLNPTYYYTTYLPIGWHWRGIMVMNGVLFLLVMCVLLLSLIVIARYRPMKAVRFQ